VSIDIDAIKTRDDTEYGMECNTDGIGTTLQYALTDRNDLLREVARLRGEVERERAAVVAYLRRAAWWDCDDCGFDGKKLVEAIELRLHRAGEGA